MRKTKLEKGITLIALIITIVVLLILAIVTIGNIQESRIINHAQNSASEYTIAQEKERIALAYSEYQIEKRLDPSKTLQIEGKDATTEQVGDYGWKVTYEDTGNVYGINSKGKYDEAVTMIIEAVNEVSEIFDELKTTNPDLNIDGISLNDFIIYEDINAITKNAENTDSALPERYVFYNWNKLTTDEMMVIEIKHNPEPGIEKVRNLSNRLLNIDVDGNGVADKNDIDKLKSAVYTAGEIEIIPAEKHDMLAKICIKDNTSIQETILEYYECSYDEARGVYYDDNDNDGECDDDEIFSPTEDDNINFIFKRHFSNGTDIKRYISLLGTSDATSIERIIYDTETTFYDRYDAHVYYNSDRTDLL